MKKSAIIFMVSSLVLAAPPSDTCKQDTWVTNGSVGAILTSGTTTYIAGYFSEIGPFTGGCLPFNTSTYTPTIAAAFPKVNGTVRAICADGSGGWFIGGLFVSVDGAARSNLAHILPNNSVDPAWNPGADSLVTSFALSGTTLYVGGTFGILGGRQRSNIGALNAPTGEATSWNPAADRTVWCLAATGTTIYAGGQFNNLGGKSRNAVAALAAASDTALSWNPDVDGIVFALAVYGSSVYIGGFFDTIGTARRLNLGAVSASTGDTTAFRADADSQVYAMAINGTNLFVGGRFAHIGRFNEERRGLAKVDATSGIVMNMDLNFNNRIYTMVADGSMIYVGGDFTTFEGATRTRIAAIDGANDRGTSWSPLINDTVLALAVGGTTLYVGGAYNSFGAQSRNRIAAMDATTGKATAFSTTVSGSIYGMAKSGTTLFICGNFTSVGGQNRKYLAALDALTGSLLGWNPNPDEAVFSLAVNGVTLYAGGQFDTINGQPRKNLAAFNSATGNLTAWSPDPDWGVEAIAVRGNTIYVGGGFYNIGGKARTHIAALDSATGTSTDWNPGANKTVFSLLLNGTMVYAMGTFDSIGGQRRNSLAAIDALTGNLLPWDPAPNKRVKSLAVIGKTVYAGGYFDVIGGQTRKFAAALDTAGNALAWNPTAFGYAVESMASSGGALFAGGSFSSLGKDIGHPNFAQFGNFTFAPQILSITPSTGIDSGMVAITDLHGAEFGADASVKFVKAGQADIIATNVSGSAAHILCSVDIKNAASGAWDVIVINQDAQADTLLAAFTVAPRPPVCVSPANDAAGIGLTPTLIWQRGANDSLYTLQISASPEFSLRIVNNNLIADTSFVVPQALLANNTAYYWKVAATKKGGSVTDFCASRKFTTVSLPGQVPLLSPSAWAYLQVDSVVFRWSRPAAGADRYCLEVFGDSLLNGRLLIDSTLTDTFFIQKGLQNNKSYWWRVAAHNGIGWGIADNVRKFTIEIPTVSMIPADYSCIVRGMSQSGSIIRYGLPAASPVTLRLYGISGRLLKTVLQTRQDAGYHRVSITERDLPKGYFILDFKAGAYKTTRIFSNF